MLIFHTPWQHQKTTGAFMRRLNLMLLAWNASSSIVKENDCKNTT